MTEVLKKMMIRNTNNSLRLSKYFTIFFCIIYLLCVYLYLLNNCDAFAPGNFSNAIDIVKTGDFTIGDSFEESTLGLYQIYHAIISLVFNIPIPDYLQIPYLMFPLAIIVVAVSREINKSSLVQAIVLILSFSTVALSFNYMFIWPHGIGFLLFWVIIYLIILYINKKLTSGTFLICATLSIVTLNYSSYTILGMFCPILLFFVMFNILSSIIEHKHLTIHINRTYVVFSIISLFIVFISAFWKTELINAFSGVEDSNISSIERLFNSLLYWLLDSESIVTRYDAIIATSSGDSLPIFGITKYLFMGFVFMSYLILLWRIKHKNKSNYKIPELDILLLAICIGVTTFTVLRIIVGSPNLQWMFIPCILSIPRIIVLLNKLDRSVKFDRLINVVSKIIIAILVISTLISFGSGLINATPIDERNLAHMDSYNSGNIWINSYCNTDLGIYCDIFTRGYFNMISNHLNIDTYSAKLRFQYDDFTLDNVLDLTSGIPVGTEEYMVLNYGQKNVLIGYDWDFIKPWSEFDAQITSHPFHNELYESSSISIHK